jgi:large subunit ribosomal protein LP0
MVKEDRKVWKSKFFQKMIRLLNEYPKCFIVGADNVGSSQMQKIRIELRGEAEILMGKNTMMKKVIRGHLENNPDLAALLPYIVENVGFVFTKDNLSTIRTKLQANKVKAPAKAGAISNADVGLKHQVTTMGPEKTSFFQALQIPTKITRGQIEIINNIRAIKNGDKVGASEATLLNMLNISPFSYGLTIKHVFENGTIYSPDILDITPEDIRTKFTDGVRRVAAVSLAIGYPTLASVPHSIANGFKKLMAVAAATEIEFEQVKGVKEYLKDPSKFASAAPVAAAATDAAPVAEKKKEKTPEPSSDEDMGFGLFD